MLLDKGSGILDYTVMFPFAQDEQTETYRVKDKLGQTRLLRLTDLSKLARFQIDEQGDIIGLKWLSQNRHSAFFSCFESGVVVLEGRQYFYAVLDFISGETLVQRLKRDEDFSIYDIKQIAISILSAMSELHTQGLIYGELSPQNIYLSLVGTYQDLRLLGVEQIRELKAKPVKPRLAYINSSYLAPECFSGVFSIASDIYAVGVVIYQLLYGRLPWQVYLPQNAKDEDLERVLDERECGIDLPMLERFELDEQLLNTIGKALQIDSEDRFKTAQEFIGAIKGEIKVEKQSKKHKISDKPNQGERGGKLSYKASVAKGEGFSAIAGLQELKNILMDEVIKPLREPEKYKRYRISIPNGMLLYGPPGCGKTFFAKHFAHEVGYNYLYITPASLKSRWVNASAENIATLFKEAEAQAPIVIFIDEINELLPARDGDAHEQSRSVVNEMLAQMDHTGEKGIFIIGATNYPHKIDSAMLRAGRLDRKYYIGLPDAESREALFQLELKGRPSDLGLDYKLLAKQTEGYVSSDIQLIVNSAARLALEEGVKITQALLEGAIQSISPSLSKSELKRYDEIKSKMDAMQSKSDSTSKQHRIGFR